MLGIIFIMHGSQKVFGLFKGAGLEGFSSWLSTYGIPPFISYMAAFFEFIAGCMLLLGICSEIAALITIPVMLGAIYLVHWPYGFFGQNKGFEYPLLLIILACAIIIAGPGKLALFNYCFGCKKC
jgi:putative oxidoreductase